MKPSASRVTLLCPPFLTVFYPTRPVFISPKRRRGKQCLIRLLTLLFISGPTNLKLTRFRFSRLMAWYWVTRLLLFRVPESSRPIRSLIMRLMAVKVSFIVKLTCCCCRGLTVKVNGRVSSSPRFSVTVIPPRGWFGLMVVMVLVIPLKLRRSRGVTVRRRERRMIKRVC